MLLARADEVIESGHPAKLSAALVRRDWPEADMVSGEIPQCSRHICELLFLIFVLGLNLLLLLNDWPLWLKRMGQRRTALRVIVRQSLPNLRHL
jgi:hypothetical protein